MGELGAHRKRSITIYLEWEQAWALADLHRNTRVPKSEYIREGIDLVLDKREAELRAKGLLP